MQPVTINGGGKEVVDLLHVRDLAEAVVRACSRRIPDRGSVFNIGGGSTRSVLDLAELCNDIARGRDLIPAPFRYGPSTTSGRVRKWGMRIDSARAVLGWTPAVRLRDGVRELFDAFLRERDDAALTAPYSKGSDRG
jgi:nucleoside-diphosphate-sugar epimerase